MLVPPPPELACPNRMLFFFHSPLAPRASRELDSLVLPPCAAAGAQGRSALVVAASHGHEAQAALLIKVGSARCSLQLLLAPLRTHSDLSLLSSLDAGVASPCPHPLQSRAHGVRVTRHLCVNLFVQTAFFSVLLARSPAERAAAVPQAKAAVNQSDASGVSPLLAAAANGHEAVTSLLLQASHQTLRSAMHSRTCTSAAAACGSMHRGSCGVATQALALPGPAFSFRPPSLLPLPSLAGSAHRCEVPSLLRTGITHVHGDSRIPF
eukprot:6173178-Pleurochrysis_carterae.AAC.3